MLTRRVVAVLPAGVTALACRALLASRLVVDMARTLTAWAYVFSIAAERGQGANGRACIGAAFAPREGCP